MHRMRGGQIDVARLVLHDRQRELFGERGQLIETFARAASAGGDDQRKLRLGEQAGGLLDSAARRRRCRRAERAHVVAPLRDRRCGQHLARERQVHGPARLAHRDVEGAVDHRLDRLSTAQLVVPFDEFAHHAALIECLLAPVDRAVARGDVPGLGKRRAAGSEQERNIVARRVHQAVDAVPRAHRHVDHDGRGLAGHAVVAVRHRHRDVLVRHRDDARKLPCRSRVPGHGFDDGREIRARVGEHELNSALGQAAEIGLGGDLLRRCCFVHGFDPCTLALFDRVADSLDHAIGPPSRPKVRERRGLQSVGGLSIIAALWSVYAPLQSEHAPRLSTRGMILSAR